jgi:uncharacterized protein
VKIASGQLRLSASDVANFVACQHLTRLDLLKARGELDPPHRLDIGFQDLIKRGEAHERQVLARLQADGRHVVAVGEGSDADMARATAAALRDGVDVVYQGVLVRQQTDGEAALLGRPDFLVRAGLLPAPGGDLRSGERHYEVVDAKLARSAKARAVVQTAFYSHLLADLQGVEPRWMYLALGNGEFVPLKVNDYAAYERQTRRVLGAFIADDHGENPPADPYPDPVEHCIICRWSEFCGGRRRRDDDLSLIAGITYGQRRALKAARITTRRGFAALADLPDLSRVSRASLERAHLQAQLQVSSEDEGHIEYEILEHERDAEGALISNRGLLALPEPVSGDLFFDIEGARYYSEDGKEFGLQYLFGVVDTADTDEDRTPPYTAIWAFDRQGEKRAFEELIDFITERRERNPGLHVYHYNHYEPTSVDHLTELHGTRQEAVGRLMGRFATREDEVDDLFRLGVFVDLYRVVRQGLRAGAESYSLKRLEPLCGYARQVDLREATVNLIAFEAALEEGTAHSDRDRQQIVAGYNQDDCRAALALRGWLEQRRLELAGRLGQDLPRPVFSEEARSPENPEVTRVRTALLADVPADPSSRTGGQQAQALLADLLDWHRREAKPAWWRYFYLRTLSADELIGEPDAIGGLIGGNVVDQVKQSIVRRFSFPPQEHRFTERDAAHDSVTGRRWSICSLDDRNGVIDLKIGGSYSGPLPTALVEGGPIAARELAKRLLDLGGRVMRDGLSGRDAATALLLRLRPDIGRPAGVPLRSQDEMAPQAALRLAVALRDSYLPIQGPPGTGKTFSGADQILELISRGRPVGIVGPSHAVICHFIDEVLKHAADRGITPRIGQRPDQENLYLHPQAGKMDYDQMARALRDRELDVAAGTAWMWARDQFQDSIETLFVDEAGQLSLANVLAVAGAARNLVLLGDPQQLAQPSQAVHPPGAGTSALEHILGDHATIPADAGLLLDRTWRMHPRLCRYTSEVFYDGKLTWADGLSSQEILGEISPHGSGLRIVEVPHQGNTNASPEEALVVARLVGDLIGRTWCNKDGDQLVIGPDDILVVTPYNAQIREIENALAGGRHAEPRVGTVDKFQGREAPVVIYSMTTSSADEAPRGLEFLYDPHRLNVATSRAKAMAIIVASPDLVRVFCRTTRQMVLVNTLCRTWESGE